MKSGRYPRDPGDNYCGRSFSSPAYVQFMGLLQDLPELQDECQPCLYTAFRLIYLWWKFIKAESQPLLPGSLQFMYLENIAC